MTVWWRFLGIFLRGQPIVWIDRMGHRLELKDVNCESWLKFRGQNYFQGGGMPPSKVGVS